MACQDRVESSTKNIPMNAELASLFEDYQSKMYEYYPLQATFAGIEGYNDKLNNDLDPSFKKKVIEEVGSIKAKMKEIDKSSLNNKDQMSYDVMMWELDMSLAEDNFPKEDYLPIDQMWSANLGFGQLASGAGAQPFTKVEDYDNWLKRVDVFLDWTRTAQGNMKEGIDKGVVLPTSLVKKVIPQVSSWGEGSVTDHLFYSPAKNIPDDINDEDKRRIEGEYARMVRERVMPVYKSFGDFLKSDYLEASRETSGIGALDFGEAYYDHQIKKYTTTTMTADQIHALGLSEVARLRSEMEGVKKQVGFEGDLKAFFEHVRSRKELMPFTDPQQVIDNFNAIHDKMKPQLAKLFDTTPKAAFEVRRTEAFREKSASAEYNPGSLDGSRPGIFYVPIPDVTKYNIYSDEDLFLHEAIPGHHYQISLQQEDEDLPDFRKTLWYSAYGEGWALYTESLGKELGLYDDPYQFFGMLGAEMHRAIRLVVDTGIHSKGWTREKAIQYSLDNEAESEASIISEIERYMANPGQALSYKIGQLKIRELRARAEEKLGDKFDIRAFHNEILEPGCIPLALLEQKIDRWIASRS